MRLPDLVGGQVCLDFANTVGPRRGPDVHDYVPGYPELAAWSEHAGLLTATQRRALAAAAEADPENAAVVVAEARRLRAAIQDAFDTVAAGDPPSSIALTAIQDTYVTALRHAHLTPAGWTWPDTGGPEQVLWPIAHSAVDLLVSGRLDRVKACPGDDGMCGWLFLDTSKNATRRWCSMRDCGSRAKSRRQVERLRAARPSEG